jgi:hypothetical protein
MQKQSRFNFLSKALPITLLALGSLPAMADFSDLSSGDLTSTPNYSNTGDSVSTSGYGEAAGNGSVENPSTETEIGLTMYLPKTVALAVNTHQSSAYTPGSIFGSETVPLSRRVIRADHEGLINGSNTEFIIRGLVASNVDNVQIDFDSNVTMTHDAGAGDGTMIVNFSGFSGAASVAAGAVGTGNAFSTGGSVDTSSGIAGIRLDGDIDSSSVDRAGDRAGQYDGQITITATTL